jgi:hypothetical protein
MSQNPSSNEARAGLDPAIAKILGDLSEDERRFFSEVIKIEHDHIHQKRPSVKEEILGALRRVIR